jgi:hypothetical protein
MLGGPRDSCKNPALSHLEQRALASGSLLDAAHLRLQKRLWPRKFLTDRRPASLTLGKHEVWYRVS